MHLLIGAGFTGWTSHAALRRCYIAGIWCAGWRGLNAAGWCSLLHGRRNSKLRHCSRGFSTWPRYIAAYNCSGILCVCVCVSVRVLYYNVFCIIVPWYTTCIKRIGRFLSNCIKSNFITAPTYIHGISKFYILLY